jgi:hypothetical protein
MRLHRMLVAEVELRQLGEARHDAQDVVEVVGDAAGEAAERLRALREMELLEQAGALFVGAPALGGVAHDADQAAVVQTGER